MVRADTQGSSAVGLETTTNVKYFEAEGGYFFPHRYRRRDVVHRYSADKKKCNP